MGKECYGERFGKLPACKTCGLADYCKDAANPPLSGHRLVEEHEAQVVTPFPSAPTPAESAVVAIMDSIAPLIRMAAESPLRGLCVAAKLSRPSRPYSDIGKELGVSKQLVAYHLRQAAIQHVPLRSALIIDGRFNCGATVLHRMRGQPPALRITRRISKVKADYSTMVQPCFAF
jgi:hypothetical protein